jgi:type II secretory pathway pseudopilin PulG
MKLKITVLFQRLFSRRQGRRIDRVRPYRAYRSSSTGFTLIELLVATLLTTIVFLIVWNGLLSALNATQIAEAKTARRTELNRAFDFMTNEIRMAQSVNRTNNLSANGTVTVEDVVHNAGLTNMQLGSFGTIALYLEIPINGTAPTICPAGGPNAGLAPPTPSDRDLVVYDIRPSSQGWLGPRSVTRYGRVPRSNGVINPCSSPISSDTLVDAISPSMNVTPNCPAPGILTGAEGFRACVTGAQVDLLFQSNVVGAQTRRLSSSVLSRPMAARPDLQLVLVRPSSTTPSDPNSVDLSWTWTGYGTGTNFKVYQALEGNSSSTTEIYNGAALATVATLNGGASENNCFIVEATNGGATAKSATECLVK